MVSQGSGPMNSQEVKLDYEGFGAGQAAKAWEGFQYRLRAYVKNLTFPTSLLYTKSRYSAHETGIGAAG